MTRKADIQHNDIPLTVGINRLFPPVEESSTLLVACSRRDYSASRIARAVEDCDAHLLNLNVTADSDYDPSNRLIVELRVNHRNPAAIARSIERYGYEVVDFETDAPNEDDEIARRRLEELIHYLEI